MKKYFKQLSALLLVCTIATICFALCSCGDDEPSGNNLSGYWMTDSYQGWDGYEFCEGLHFTSSNTVVYYSYLANGKYWSNGLGGSQSFPGKNGWYYQGGSNISYTYTKDGNNLYLLSTEYNDAKVLNFAKFHKVK